MNDIGRVEEELSKKEFAVMITEGGGAHMTGQIPWDIDYIRALSELSRKYGTVWVMDEAVTVSRKH